jgi:hypothetical protein
VSSRGDIKDRSFGIVVDIGISVGVGVGVGVGMVGVFEASLLGGRLLLFPFLLALDSLLRLLYDLFL